MAPSAPHLEADAPRPSAAQEAGFVHLHLHSEYSLLDGGNRLDRLLARVKDLGMDAVGVTDHGNLFGAVAFYTAAKAGGVKPILGVEAYVTPPGKPRQDRTYAGGGEGGYHLVLLAMNEAGWRNLLVLCSEAFLTGFYYKPRIDRELLAAHAEGLIAINGHLGSEIGEHLLAYERSGEARHWEAAVESARWHAGAFGGTRDEATARRKDEPESSATLGVRVSPSLPRFYIELQRHVPEQNSILPHLVRLARELNLPLVADNDAHFLRAEDHDAHDTLICISTQKAKSAADRMRYPPQLYVKSPGEMRALCDGEAAEVRDAWREACDNSVRIARACALELPIGRNHAPMVRVRRRGAGAGAAELPRWDDPRFGGDLSRWHVEFGACFEVTPFDHEPSPAELAEARRECDDALRALARAGAVWRYGPGIAERDAPTGAADGAPGRSEVLARLERELDILCDKGISAYFLIVWDFVSWGRAHAIPALARGSGVGTMVGYVLGLSNACPVRYGLLFERFTDPDRSEYPDIDIDLCQDGRARVIEHVRRKYGHVAQIITFGTLKARAAIRDVARVLEIPLAEADRIAKLVPEQLNITLDDALVQEPRLKELYESDDRIRRLLDNARALEGQARHASVHAAGVIVATRPLHEIVPLYKPSDSNDIVTQWDGPTCEKMGLLKMDFLGLRTISVIERCKALIRQTLPERAIWEAVGREPGAAHHPLDLDRLTYDDPNVFDLFQRGETTGVFQFESGGMRRLLVEMKPDRLEDLIAANALFRPGPMDLIPDYNRRKHGLDPVPSLHPVVDGLTAETYGVMVYQEQVMRIVHELGGIPLRAAYTLIKAISKKQQKKIDAERPRFVEGAVSRGLARPQAENLFELILKFAGYGFNKSHSTGYAIVAYQTAYLKTYFPNQYMAVFLSYESAASKNADWVPYLEDCKRARFIDAATGRILRVGVEVRPPDVNLSEADFSVVFEAGEPCDARHGHVRFGLGGIKGAGEKAVEAIVRERRPETATRETDEAIGDGQPASQPPPGSAPQALRPFTSLFEFCERVLGRGTGVINKATIEALVKSGAFDSIHGRPARAALCATIEQAMSAAQKLAIDRAAGQGALFGLGAAAPERPAPAASLAATPAWNERQTLEHEKSVLGFYISSHPLDRVAPWIQAFCCVPVGEVRDRSARERILLGGLVQSVRSLVTKNGKQAGQRMAVVTLEDRSGTIQCVLFPEANARYGHLATPDALVFLTGEVDLARGEPQVIVDRVLPIDATPKQPIRWLDLLLDVSTHNGSAAAVVESTRDALADLIAAQHSVAPPTSPDAPAPRPVPLRLYIQLAEGERPVPIPVADGWSLPPTTDTMAALARIVGEGRFKVYGPLLAREDEARTRAPGRIPVRGKLPGKVGAAG